MTYHYKMCGLDYVYLLNGFRTHETEYGEGVSIENAKDLDQTIAVTVISSLSRLRGQEVRFLRALTHLSQTELANELGIKRVTVARWEGAPNTPIPGPADRVIRIVVSKVLLNNSECIEFIADVFPEIGDKFMDDLYMSYGPDEVSSEPSLFPDDKSGDDGWKSKRMAA